MRHVCSISANKLHSKGDVSTSRRSSLMKGNQLAKRAPELLSPKKVGKCPVDAWIRPVVPLGLVLVKLHHSAMALSIPRFRV